MEAYGLDFQGALRHLASLAGIPLDGTGSKGANRTKNHAALVTVEALARDKFLPVEFLRSLGLKDTDRGVEIPYFFEDGATAARRRIRTALRAGDGSYWETNARAIVPYGLQRLAKARAAGFLVIVEGESDSLTLWHHGFPCVGIPGASHTKCLQPEHLAGIKKIFVVEEPGKGGSAFVDGLRKRFAEMHWVGEVRVVSLLPHKDPNELHKTNPEMFPENFYAFLDRAERFAADEGRTLGIVLRPFSDITSKPLRWLWPGRIPLGKLTLLIGDPGLGKSLMTIDIASRATRGTSFPDGATCESGSVVFLSAEDDAGDTIRPRLDASAADVSRVHSLEAVRVQLKDGSITEKTFNLETDCAALERALSEHPDVRLIVIDPISAYLGGVDSHSNAEVRSVLAPLAALAAQYGVAVLCITHLRKSAGAAVYRAIESIAFTAASRAVLAVASDPEDANRRLLLQVKQNLSPSMGGLAFRIETQNNVPRLAWDAGTVSVTADEVLNIDACGNHSEQKWAEQWLGEYLGDGPVAANEVIAAAGGAGISKTTLWRAAKSLRVKRRKLGGRGAGWEWFQESSSGV
jgi:hypothetical protein